MTPEQALQILSQVFATKNGLDPSAVMLTAQAWQVISNLVAAQKPLEEIPKENNG